MSECSPTQKLFIQYFIKTKGYHFCMTQDRQVKQDVVEEKEADHNKDDIADIDLSI